MIVVSDTTPIIALMKVRCLKLLQGLFDVILIPEGVYRELTSNESFPEEAEQIKTTDYVKVVSVKEYRTVDVLRRSTGLDLGESEAIVYADSQKADFLLMDEAKGRKVAENMGLKVMGTIGVLLASHEIGLMTSEETREAILGLKTANQRISDSLVREALNRIDRKEESS